MKDRRRTKNRPNQRDLDRLVGRIAGAVHVYLSENLRTSLDCGFFSPVIMYRVKRTLIHLPDIHSIHINHLYSMSKELAVSIQTILRIYDIDEKIIAKHSDPLERLILEILEDHSRKVALPQAS